jgi:hypothetical protein
MYNSVCVGDSFAERRVAFVSRKNKSKTEIAAPSVPGRTQRLALFGPPLLIEGEDAAAYDQLLARICVAVKPVNIIDDIYIVDVMTSEWEVLRWRRLKSSVIQALGLEMLEGFLSEKFDYALYSEYFADDLTEILQVTLPENQAENARTLASKCAQNDPDANDEVKEVLASIGLKMGKVLVDARARKAKDLVHGYVRREPNARALIHKLLTAAGKSMDTFMAAALAQKFDYIERIDRLITIAENRRDGSLHEIDRRRAVLGEALRRSVQEIEDAEFEVIGTTPAN